MAEITRTSEGTVDFKVNNSAGPRLCLDCALSQQGCEGLIGFRGIVEGKIDIMNLRIKRAIESGESTNCGVLDEIRKNM